MTSTGNGIGSVQVPLGAGCVLVVFRGEVALHGPRGSVRSLSNWLEVSHEHMAIDADYYAARPHIITTPRFPDDLRALLGPVLAGGEPAPLVDWLIDNAPEEFRWRVEAAVEAMAN